MANQASAASSSSAPSCPASTSYPHYDVFINHRGPDVKKTFAAHLYRRLVDNRFRVFLDKPEMLPGQPITPQILAAIEVAHVHVAIFSPGYAQSNWCLDELELMLKTTKRAINRATILPVFYNVKPSDLRYPTKGAYAEALSNREKKERYDSNTIESWSKALTSAAEISGFELDGDEEELLMKVVQSVLENVPKPLLEVAEYPTGVEEKFQELQEKLREFEMKMLSEHQGRMRAQVVGIVGFGGLGKTTLAKLFFNRKRSHYQESSFLFDVRETATRKSLSYLQSKLLRDLKYKNGTKIDNPEEGKVILKQHLSSRHVLIIIDDVEDATQLKSLVPMDILTPESLILVTTRDTHVLIESGVSLIYKMTELNMTDSKELFCSYAFHQSFPPTEFAEPVDRFVTACNGLPLSLKVIGALLCRKNADYWEQQFDRLRQTLPSKIFDRLRISYDSLCSQDQEIFLDIGCFFIGENRDRAVRICGLVGIQNLEDKCLLEVDSENNIKMHDHIRDCARSIAEEKSMPRRLWYQMPTNVIDSWLEKSSTVEIEVRGITTMDSISTSDYKYRQFYDNCMEESLKKHLFNNSDFRGMKNLRFVATSGASLEAILGRFHSSQLSWLRWYGCSCSSLPDWISMKNLRVLEVQGNDMESLWPQQSQGPFELRELNICAPLSNFPKSIGQLEHLEWIHITVPWSLVRAPRIETLPQEFCDLRSLKYLVLERFSKLISLPDSFGKLTNLQHINLTDASSLQRLPNSFGELTNLQHINLTNASCLRWLPNSFGNLTQLKYLCLRGCSKLTISNGALASIARLEYLNLDGCTEVRELPPQVSHQRSLKELHLKRTKLKELPCGIGDLCNLEILEIGWFPLELLPSSLGNLKSLKRFSLELSPKVKCLPDSFGMLTQLRELSLSISGIEYLPQDFPKLNNLERLWVIGCPLREVSFFLRGEGEVEISSLEGGSGWNKLDSANDKCMFGLKQLRLVGAEISKVSFSDGVCPNLQDVELHDCEELEELERLETLKSLEQLKVVNCRKLKSIPGLGQLKKLRKLIVEHCMLLETLEVQNCPRLKSIPELGQLPKLVVRGFHEIEGLPGVEHCMLLDCPRLKSIPELGQLPKLQQLHVSGCHEIEELPGVEHCTSLKYLTARDCPKLRWGRGVLQQLRLRLKSDLCIDVIQYKRQKK